MIKSLKNLSHFSFCVVLLVSASFLSVASIVEASGSSHTATVYEKPEEVRTKGSKKLVLKKSSVKSDKYGNLALTGHAWNTTNVDVYCGIYESGTVYDTDTLTSSGQLVTSLPMTFNMSDLTPNIEYQLSCMGVHVSEGNTYLSNVYILGSYIFEVPVPFFSQEPTLFLPNGEKHILDFQAEVSEPTLMHCALSKKSEAFSSKGDIMQASQVQPYGYSTPWVSNSTLNTDLYQDTSLNYLGNNVHIKINNTLFDEDIYVLQCVLQDIGYSEVTSHIYELEFTHGVIWDDAAIAILEKNTSVGASHGAEMKAIMVQEYGSPSFANRIQILKNNSFDTLLKKTANQGITTAVRSYPNYYGQHNKTDRYHTRIQSFLPYAPTSSPSATQQGILSAISTCNIDLAVGVCQNPSYQGDGLEFIESGENLSGTNNEVSWANARAAAKIIKIKDARASTLWEARYAARQTAIHPDGVTWNLQNGYGVIDVNAAIAWTGQVPSDPYNN